MIGEKIRSIRKSKKITQRELSEKTGISVSYIQQLEYKTKGNPSYETLNTIANALGVSINNLTEENGYINICERRNNQSFSENDEYTPRISESQIKRVLGEVINNVLQYKNRNSVENDTLDSLVNDCYKYIEFLIYKAQK